jgi:hypothetical protein
MSRSNGARAIMLQALGSMETDDLQTALGIVLGTLHAEAKMLQMGENLGSRSEMLEYAHANRLKALEEFFDEHVIVSWRETTVQAKPEAAE